MDANGNTNDDIILISNNFVNESFEFTMIINANGYALRANP